MTYLSFDRASDAVVASQVMPYVERLARRGVDVSLHSFETEEPPPILRARMENAGVRWVPHRLGWAAAAGGLARVARAALITRGAPLVHARSHLAGAAAVVGRPQHWVWDVRSLWTEQRIEQRMLRRGSPVESTLRFFERRAAGASDAIVTLASAAVPVLESRTGCAVGPKTRVISTCVDLDHFAVAPAPTGDGVVRLLLSGSLNALYDVPAMIAFAARFSALAPAALEWAGGPESPWSRDLAAAGVVPAPCPFGDMPSRIAESHAGMCLLRLDLTSSAAATPTKVAEFLACGRPVVVSAGLGDLPAILADGKCGVVVDDTSSVGLDRAAAELAALLDDPGLGARCRAAAEEHFDVERGVDTLLETYRAITAG
ncbi:MAG TPA: glycosyltransferase [Acidimicrobiia bacterium]|nr:glycosyltransferase [Acidimicrobiia bacterium]